MAERQNKHCIMPTTAPDLEDGDGYEVLSPLQCTEVLKPLRQAARMPEMSCGTACGDA